MKGADNLKVYSEFDTSIGPLVIVAEGGYLTGVYMGYFGKNGMQESDSHPLLAEARKQLAEYFAGDRKYFDLPLWPEGTHFQKSVWKAVFEIPYGETASYQEIAIAAGYPKAYRAVGTAIGKNPICLIVPCHRVIKSDGSLGNYAYGPEIKKALIQLESAK